MLYSLASPAAAAALVQVSKRMFHNENISKLKLNGMTEIEKWTPMQRRPIFDIHN